MQEKQYMEKVRQIPILLSLILLGMYLPVQADSKERKIFYWERPNTGVGQFAKDHRDCMLKADILPFELPSRTKEPKTLRFDDDSGVWGNFIPYPGALPVNVKYEHSDRFVNYDNYQQCMEQRHYTQRLPNRVNDQAFSK